MSTRFQIDVKRLSEVAHNLEVTGNVLTFDLQGPPDSPYEGGVWKVRVETSSQFPYKSPSVGFVDKIFHPNVDLRSGSICLNVLNQTWTPIYNLRHIHDTFIPQLLLYPNAEDPLNQEAAELFLKNQEEFKVKVREYTSRRLSKSASVPPSEDDSA